MCVRACMHSDLAHLLRKNSSDNAPAPQEAQGAPPHPDGAGKKIGGLLRVQGSVSLYAVAAQHTEVCLQLDL